MTKGKAAKRQEAAKWKGLGNTFKLPAKHRDWVRLMNPPEPHALLEQWRTLAAEQGTTLPDIVYRKYREWRRERLKEQGKAASLRFKVKVPEELHRRVQGECSRLGLAVESVLLTLLEERFPPSERSEVPLPAESPRPQQKRADREGSAPLAGGRFWPGPMRKPGRPLAEGAWSRARTRFFLNEEHLAMARATGFTPAMMEEVAGEREGKRDSRDPLPLHATAGQIQAVKRRIWERYAEMTERGPQPGHSPHRPNRRGGRP